MNTNILCVDDEPHVLAAQERQLRKDFVVKTALGGELGLQAVRTQGPFAVIVTDMRMPGMSGVEFLSRVRQLAPDSVRMMLTGNNDQQTAMRAINDGHIFRFLTKPCTGEPLVAALRAGLEQYRLITAEKELLEQTLWGSIKVLTEVLSLVNPVAFGRAMRVQRLVRKIGESLQAPDIWRLEVAAMLSQIGCVTVPEPILEKVCGGQSLTANECQMFQRHPQLGCNLIAQIPRLEGVARTIAYQEKCFDGRGVPEDDVKGDAIPLGARILKAVLDFDSLESCGHTRMQAIAGLEGRPGWYDPVVLGALGVLCRAETPLCRKLLAGRDLRPGMILDDNIVHSNGVLVLRKGQEITETLLQRLNNFRIQNKIREPIAVLTAPDG